MVGQIHPSHDRGLSQFDHGPCGALPQCKHPNRRDVVIGDIGVWVDHVSSSLRHVGTAQSGSGADSRLQRHRDAFECSDWIGHLASPVGSV